ncbi:hypothetical protein B7P43_G13168 [Cryptotermes secundus]|uniref:Uncharacterized protein n=1 Tax=Cryptotermes secundus TaxID=105785 RepID=A0A2J7Q440_9NEOP|nr:hypothetical protein B7P43_G13168 [Cryptotermes secundus]
MANRSFEHVARVQILWNDSNKSKFDSGLNSFQNLLSSRPSPKNVKIRIQKCGAGSMALREEHRLRMLENRALRRIFGPKRNVREDWRKLHNEELNDAYYFSSVIRMSTSRHYREISLLSTSHKFLSNI